MTTIRRRKAQKFLEFLTDSSRKKGEWIYRGQSNDSHRLIPTIVRGRNISAMGTYEFHQLASTELTLVEAFVEKANLAGLSLPAAVVPHKRSSFVPAENPIFVDEFNLNDCKRAGFVSLNAILARHSGIPSRLHDWTFNPLVASYFAADHQPPEFEATPKGIAVWGVRKSALVDLYISCVEYPYDRYIFIRNQESLCLYDELLMSNSYREKRWVSLDDSFTRLDDNDVFKLTLPFAERLELMKLLEPFGITRDFLMPVFSNIANAVVESTSVDSIVPRMWKP